MIYKTINRANSCVLAFIASGIICSNAMAQSIEAFETLPVLQNKPLANAKIDPPQIAQVPPIIENPYKPAQYSIQYQAQIDAAVPQVPVENYIVKENKTDDTIFASAPNNGPLRMTYYRVPMNVIALDKKPQSDQHSIQKLTKPKAKTVWDYFKKPQPDAASPQATNPQRQRGPWRAIYEDTKSAIKNDLPQALADSLPWVDYERKQIPFDIVLNKVADGLNRASKEDPEWAINLKPELMDLARKMDAMPSPPQYKAEYAATEIKDEIAAKSFKKRPVWPGAKITDEEQIRPFALTSQTENELGGKSEILPASVKGDNFEDLDSPPKNTKKTVKKKK